VSSGCAPPWSQCAAGGAARVTGIVRVLNLRHALLVGVRVLVALALGLLARLRQVLLVGVRVLGALALGLFAPLRQAITGFPGLPPLGSLECWIPESRFRVPGVWDLRGRVEGEGLRVRSVRCWVQGAGHTSSSGCVASQSLPLSGFV
jgi:hypothetical protein